MNISFDFSLDTRRNMNHYIPACVVEGAKVTDNKEDAGNFAQGMFSAGAAFQGKVFSGAFKSLPVDDLEFRARENIAAVKAYERHRKENNVADSKNNRMFALGCFRAGKRFVYNAFFKISDGAKALPF